MEINKNIEAYKTDIIKISYESYTKELAYLKYIPVKTFENFEQYMNEKMENIKGLVYLEEGKCTAYLLYHEWEENAELHCSIPEYGYGSISKNREKTISYLFQTLAEDIVSGKTVNFSVHLYAHDIEMQRLFSYMEFGIQAETGIRILKNTDVIPTEYIRELQKEEIEDRWKDIWYLLEKLIKHLRMSPIFYSGEEFTEDVYKEFFLDVDTRVFVAEEDGKMVGLIEANRDNIPFLFPDHEVANVGEIYVLPQYRRKNIAQALLSYANQALLQDNYQYVWVEHGTANPNARYFWNQYFSTYTYEMIRKI